MLFPYSKLQQWLIKDRLADVMATLEAKVDEVPSQSLREELHAILRRWEHYRRARRRGENEANGLRVERLQISQAVREWLQEMKAEDAAERPWLPYLKWGALLLILGIAAWGIASFWPEPEESVSTPTPIVEQPKEDTPLDTPQQTPPKEEPKAPTRTADPSSLPPPSAPLQLDGKTNKGINNLVFQPEETMRVYYKVTRPCYLRVIYRLADGQMILLEDDRQVTAAEAGQYLELGDGYEAAPPFGKESLYLFAQQRPFPPLETRLENGYRIITQGLDETLRRSRGMKKKTAYDEFQIELTTKP